MRLIILVITAASTAAALAPPAGTRSASRGATESILPGGRIVTPQGVSHETGPGPFGLAISPSGNVIISANGGPNRYSLTVLRRQGGTWTSRHIMAPVAKTPEAEKNDWRSVFKGLAFASENLLYASEGNSGRVRLIDLDTGEVKRIFALGGDAYTGDLALDRDRGILYVLDQAGFRMVAIDTGSGQIKGAVGVGRLPFSIALTNSGRQALITNIGMFEYKHIPGTDPKRARETGLPFPAYGFPSAESMTGARRETTAGPVNVPPLGDPNVPESNSLAVVDLSDPAAPKLEALIPTGLPFGGNIKGGSSPSGVTLGDDRIFVSNGHNDSITVIDAKDRRKLAPIELRIPGFESLRGVLPIGMAYHEGRLYVAEAGINAIAVIDARQGRVLGHIPAGWFPTAIGIHNGQLFVTNAKGMGTGPNAGKPQTFQGQMRRGSIQVLPIPGGAELAGLTAKVMANNGFGPQKPEPALTSRIRYAVLIVKENRTLDEVFGARPRVKGAPELARFDRKVTPNHHSMADRWAISDNFYADSEVSVDGHHWLVGTYPNAWTESTLMAAYGGQKDFRLPTESPGRLHFPQSNSSLHPEEQLEAGAIWHHLERHGISFRNYGEGLELAGVVEGAGEMPTGARYLTNVPLADPLYRNTSRDYPQYNMNIPDQYRATHLIREIEQKYIKGRERFPRFLYIHLPNDHMAKPRPVDGYPKEASYVADNDYALGRILEFLSGTPWWKEMAVFITEDDAQGGVDHVDSHRTVMMVGGPYAKKDYVAHTNASFPGLLKTVFGILRIPPLNLYDAAAASLNDCFMSKPDFERYKLLPVDAELFDPRKAKDPLDPQPSPPLDDPSFLQEQHRRP